MNHEVWVKLAQAIVMLAASFGIQVTEDMATSIVMGAFALLSILSAVKAWMARNKQT